MRSPPPIISNTRKKVSSRGNSKEYLKYLVRKDIYSFYFGARFPAFIKYLKKVKKFWSHLEIPGYGPVSDTYLV